MLATLFFSAASAAPHFALLEGPRGASLPCRHTVSCAFRLILILRMKRLFPNQGAGRGAWPERTLLGAAATAMEAAAKEQKNSGSWLCPVASRRCAGRDRHFGCHRWDCGDFGGEMEAANVERVLCAHVSSQNWRRPAVEQAAAACAACQNGAAQKASC